MTVCHTLSVGEEIGRYKTGQGRKRKYWNLQGEVISERAREIRRLNNAVYILINYSKIMDVFLYYSVKSLRGVVA